MENEAKRLKTLRIHLSRSKRYLDLAKIEARPLEFDIRNPIDNAINSAQTAIDWIDKKNKERKQS